MKKLIFINLFPTVRLDLSPCIDLMYRVSDYCLTPASLGTGGRGSRTILLSGVNYSLHFSRRWISGWRSLLSPLSPHYHCSQPVSPLPFSVLSFFFLCYHRKASTCACTPWGMPGRTGGWGGDGGDLVVQKVKNKILIEKLAKITLKWIWCSGTVCQLTSWQDKTHIYICPNGSRIILETSYLGAGDTALFYPPVNRRTWWEFAFIANTA